MQKSPKSNFNLPATEIQHVPSRHLHLLILVVFEFELVNVLLECRHLGPVEGRRFRVTGKNVFSDGVFGQKGVRSGDRDHAVGRGLVNLTGGAAFVWLRVLDFVAVRQLANNRLNHRESQTEEYNYRFLFPTSVMAIILHCIHWLPSSFIFACL